MSDGTIKHAISNHETDVLDRAILSIRSTRPHVDSTLPYTVYSRGDYAQVWINTSACRFSLSGKCSICDYWDGEFSNNAVKLVCGFIETHGNDYTTILINTCGSCLCENELPFIELCRVVESIAKTHISRVIFETHLTYVTPDKLGTLLEVLCDKEVVIEYGQESTSSEVLKYCLNKPSMLQQYAVIEKIRELGIKVFANVVLGVPFLSVNQRINDAVNSIRNLLNSSVDSIVLFPINIKPYTLVKFLYDNGYYRRVHTNEIITVLESFGAIDLEKIELAWFEPQREVQAAYEERGLSPLYCAECGNRVLSYLNEYCTIEDGISRKNCIQQLSGISCSCRASVDDDFPNIQKCYEFLEERFPRGGVYAAN